MTDDVLKMDGKTYISSGSASSLVGYTKDYIGQLARNGKVDAKLIGRSWYISKDSIQDHKDSVNYTLTQPKKKRKIVSHVTKNTNKHIVNSSKKAFVTTPSKATELPEQEQKSHTQGNEVLVDSDIEFETVKPLFYEDDRPAIPEPKRNEYYENVPILSPHKSTSVQKRKPTSVSRISHQRTTDSVCVDGVRIHRTSSEIKKQRPMYNKERVEVSRTHTLEHKKFDHKPSKAIPVLGSVAVFAAFVVWYLATH